MNVKRYIKSSGNLPKQFSAICDSCKSANHLSMNAFAEADYVTSTSRYATCPECGKSDVLHRPLSADNKYKSNGCYKGGHYNIILIDSNGLEFTGNRLIGYGGTRDLDFAISTAKAYLGDESENSIAYNFYDNMTDAYIIWQADKYPYDSAVIWDSRKDS